ncbi:putative glutamate decarboxylase [Rosellinia necatrix]|uniref:Putative glutamate decarboxylase n=1 Tax=Rosellinia necatrix TaxID=77044 RepID=A0A1W2TQG3_ROSNE|nr:putative glutamate decarboxylase [Rosellinia necatrix]
MPPPHTNGNGASAPPPPNRADEVEDLVNAVTALIVPHVRAADEAAALRAQGGLAGGGEGEPSRNVLVESHRPADLVKRLGFSLPEGQGRGKDGLLDAVRDVLRYSVNTWDQGFLDKLYSSTNAVGVVSDMLLAVLNTNVHVYQTSPSLTVVEKTTSRALAALFGLAGPRAGGVTCPGGSASNLTSLITARNTLYPETKTAGNAGFAFALFTSAHGHYSVEKAATAAGMGSGSVVAVAVDGEGRMVPAALAAAVAAARAAGSTPLYVNATAGTTVLGSFDPLGAIADVCAREGLWLHVDASWGGPVAFSAAHRHKVAGAARADSLTVNPHKMMNVPIACSFLLTRDLAVFHRANTLPAGYLFHGDEEEEEDDDDNNNSNNSAGEEEGGEGKEREYWDLADLTLQCGRRGDSLKLALAWIYYGAAGFEAQVDHAFEMASLLASLVEAAGDLVLLSSNPPPCLQVCFYHAPGGAVGPDPAATTRRTRAVVRRLVDRGFMIDYAPGDLGCFLRAVVNSQTRRATVEGLMKALDEVGKEVGGSY